MSFTGTFSQANRFTGNYIALVSPFTNTGELDLDSFEKMIAIYSKSKIDGVVICGTTGESPTLSFYEHKMLVQAGVKAAHAAGLKAIAGTGSNSTKEAVELTTAAKSYGADACLIASPYYNKPSPRGVKEHFEQLNEVGIPLIVYNIPGRTGINLSPDCIVNMAAEFEQVVGLKASNGDMEEITQVVDLCDRRSVKLDILSGDDSITLPILAVGGVGTIAVISNIMPKVISQMVGLMGEGKAQQAAAISTATFGLCKQLLKAESNPAPAKFLLHKLDLIASDQVRLPLVTVEQEPGNALIEEFNVCLARLQKLEIEIDSHLQPIALI